MLSVFLFVDLEHIRLTLGVGCGLFHRLDSICNLCDEIMMLDDINGRPNVKNWASLVKNMLSNLGFYHVWVAQGVGDENNFLSTFKQRVSDHFIQNWHQRLNESSRATFYRQICVFQFQPYLEKILHKKFRNALSKLRLSSHKLHIESSIYDELF